MSVTDPKRPEYAFDPFVLAILRQIHIMGKKTNSLLTNKISRYGSPSGSWIGFQNDKDVF